MTTPEALNTLADRVEREEPSRPLEGEIFETVGGQLWELAYAHAQEPCGCPEDTARNDARLRAPRYTTSLDSAVSLVPEGWAWLHLSFDVMTCVQKTDDDKEWPPRVHGTGRTLAAALTAAALRARAAITQTQGGE